MACGGYTHAEALDIPEILHRLGEMRIAVVDQPRSAEVVTVNLSKRAAGILDLDPVFEPGNAYRRMGPIIITMHDGVAHQLLQRDDGVVRLPDLQSTGGKITGDRNMNLQNFVQPAEQVWKRTVEL